MPDASPRTVFLEKDLQKIPGIPAVASRIFRMVESADTDAMDIARAIALDPRLTAKVLKTVNSPFYSPRTPILAVPQAVTRMGFRNVRNLVLVECMPFRNAGAADPVAVALWEHDVASAVGARWIAARKGGMQPDDAYVAGLLHDIGKHALRAVQPAEFAEVVEEVLQGGRPFLDVEREQLGYTHADVGAALLKQWQMPEAIRAGVLAHHAVHTAPNPPMWAASELASRASKAVGIGVQKQPDLAVSQCDGGGLLRFSADEEQALLAFLPGALNAEMELFRN